MFSHQFLSRFITQKILQNSQKNRKKSPIQPSKTPFIPIRFHKIPLHSPLQKHHFPINIVQFSCWKCAFFAEISIFVQFVVKWCVLQMLLCTNLCFKRLDQLSGKIGHEINNNEWV